MKQQLTDLIEIVKTDRRIWAIGGFIIIALFVWSMTASTRTTRGQAGLLPDQMTASSPGTGATEAYNDLIVAFNNDIQESKARTNKVEMMLERQSNEFNEHRHMVTGIFETLADKLEQLAREVDALSKRQTENEIVPVTPPPEVGEPDDIERIGYEPEPVTPDKPQPPEITRVSVITPGDSVSVKLLTGVNAPTDGTPYPVVFQLEGPVTGPDGASLELGQARLIAAAQGSESDGRALFRITSLAMTHPDGRRSVIEVDGWIVGEDGVRGMQGVLIDKLGRLIVATAGVSFAAALGTKIEDNNNYYYSDGERGINVDSADFEESAGSAMVDASNRLGQILIDRYESLVPVVEILPGREVVAIFSRTSEIEILDGGDFIAGGIQTASLD